MLLFSFMIDWFLSPFDHSILFWKLNSGNKFAATLCRPLPKGVVPMAKALPRGGSAYGKGFAKGGDACGKGFAKGGGACGKGPGKGWQRVPANLFPKFNFQNKIE